MIGRLFSVKSQVINISSFVAPTISATTTQMCCFSMKTATHE